MTQIPSPVSTNAFVESRVRSVTEEFDGLKKFCEGLNIRGTFLFFGSARSRYQNQLDTQIAQCESTLSDPRASDGDKAKAAARIETIKSQQWLVDYMARTEELARLLTEWATSEEGVKVGLNVNTNFPRNDGGRQPLALCSGGGPGFMEASNKGAFEAGGMSIGIGVELPFEARLNDFVTHGFTCRTFFARKYWEVFCAKAMIVCPGGVGSLDEMFEVMTLMQCEKMPKIPIVLLGKEFFTTAINLRFVADRGLMTHGEIDSLCITDDPREALDHIRRTLVAEADKNLANTPASPASSSTGVVASAAV